MGLAEKASQRFPGIHPKTLPEKNKSRAQPSPVSVKIDQAESNHIKHSGFLNSSTVQQNGGRTI